MKPEISALLGKAPLIAGVVASQDDAVRLQGYAHCLDLVEWRLDGIRTNEARDLILEVNKPIIITPRAPSEGGRNDEWAVPADRFAVYREHMQIASFIDVEVLTALEMNPILEEARSAGVGIILSHHLWGNDFPGMNYFESLWGEAARLRGDVFKLAVEVQTHWDLTRLAVVSHEASKHIRTTAMAMGSFGKLSRVFFGCGDAPIVYGHLGNPRVLNQGSAPEIGAFLSKFKL